MIWKWYVIEQCKNLWVSQIELWNLMLRNYQKWTWFYNMKYLYQVLIKYVT
jgi:hypothetical protein